jgi:hypothetical protein
VLFRLRRRDDGAPTHMPPNGLASSDGCSPGSSSQIRSRRRRRDTYVPFIAGIPAEPCIIPALFCVIVLRCRVEIECR